MEPTAETVKPTFDVIESIRRHINQLKPITSERGLVCIGDYPAKLLLKETYVENDTGNLPIFIQKASAEKPKVSQPAAALQNLLNMEADVDSHFWFNVNDHLSTNEEYSSRLRSMTDRLHEAIILVSLWEGLGSALLPMLISQFKKSNGNAIALAVLPSKAQPSDAHFNALAALGVCASSDSATVILLGRDFAEDYVGVDRNGSRMTGNSIINYLLEMMLAEETLTHELCELSRAFSVKLYTGLSIMGASYKVYGSFENMLDAASLNPFLPFDLTSASVIYVLARVPRNLKDKLPRGKIELETAKWSKNIANVKSIYVSEPIYVDELSDRVDAVVFVGGFNLGGLTAFLQKKTDKVKSEMVKKGLIKEKEWDAIVKSLTVGQ